MIETDLSMMDNMVEYAKQLVLGCIVKDQDKADAAETKDSMLASNIYLHSVQGTCTFDMFNYDKDIISSMGIDDVNAELYAKNNDLIPNQYKQPLLKKIMGIYKENYIELNNYYRMLAGLPDIDDIGIKVTDKIPYVDITKYLHEMDDQEIQLLEFEGIIDKIKKQNPDKKYLNFLGINKIDPYISRMTQRFGLLYVPSIKYPEIATKFKELYERDRVYTLTCIYSDAFKYGSDYYDNFISIFIRIQAVIDLISELPNFIIRKEFFDIRSVKEFFIGNGITFFEEIPMKFQLAMVKNLNQLLKYKSSTRNIVDICSLFGFKNIELFKYYLLKDRTVDLDGNYVFEKTRELDPVTGKYVEVDDVEKNYELKFIKVPIDGSVDNYIRDESSHVDYEEMTNGDKYWTGGMDPSDVKKKILQKEFNIDRTKYLSIDTIYEMDKLSFEIAYFFNIIYDDVYLEENLRLRVNSIRSGKLFKLKHVVFYLYLLSFEQRNLKDAMFDTASKVLSVTGFNFKADLGALANYLNSQHYTFEDLGIEDFTIPKGQLIGFNQLVEIYLRNKKVYKHIVKQMANAEDADIYRIYEKIYNALMVTEVNDKIFKLPNGKIATTYTEYFKAYDPDIYAHIMQIRSLSGKEKENAIGDTIIAILMALEEYIQSDEFDYLFMNMPGISSDIMKSYILKVINFYKSYKVSITKINTIYRFDDSARNKIKIIDTKRINGQFDAKDIVQLKEYTQFEIYFKLIDSTNIRDQILISWCLDLPFDDINIRDDIVQRILAIDYDASNLMFSTRIDPHVDVTVKDNLGITDLIEITRTSN